MKYKRALIKCRRCGKWSGWISRTKGGVKAIDTTCSCCGRRLRHTERRDNRGAHNRTTSVSSFEACMNSVDVKREAASRNSRGQMDRARVHNKTQGFVKAKDWDDVRLR